MSNQIIEMVYVNYKGKTDVRKVLPIHIWHGISDYHTERQWFLHAFDVDKKAVRDFAMKDIKEFI